MQENNFEKQVQQKMEDLKIDPSINVWQKVSLSITKRKRDWRIFYLFSLFFIFITAGSILWWSNRPAKRQADAVSTSQAQPIIEKRNSKQTDIIQLPSASSIDNEEVNSLNSDVSILHKDSLSTTRYEVPDKPGMVEENLDSNEVARKESRKSHNDRKKYSSKSKTAIAISSGEPSETRIIDTLKTEEDEISIVNPPSSEQVISNHHFSKLTIKDFSILPSQKEKIQGASIDPVNRLDPKISAAKILSSPIRNKWTFGLSFSAGISTTRSGYLGIVGKSQAEEEKLYSTPSNSTGSGGAIPVRTPSTVKLGNAFVAGVYAQRRLNSRTALEVGFNYKSYATKMLLGNRIDSFSNVFDASYYYRAGSNFEYTNTYHFVELPVGVLFRLNKEKAVLPIHLYTGVSLSKLIKTTSLQFDEQSGSYFHNDDRFNNTQFDLSARLSFAIFNKGGNPLLIGPQLNYSLTKVAGTGLYQNRHYSYFGLHLQKGFARK